MQQNWTYCYQPSLPWIFKKLEKDGLDLVSSENKIQSISATTYFSRIRINDQLVYVQLDSGSNVSTIPINLLSDEQADSILPSSIQIIAYGNQKVANLGQIQLDISFDGGVVLEKQDLLVMGPGIMPVFGTNILFGRGGSFAIDKEKLQANLQGHEIEIFTEAIVDKKMNVLQSVNVRDSAENQVIVSMEKVQIPAMSEVILPAKIKLPPRTTHFLVEDQAVFRFERGERHSLPVARGLYCSNQFQIFPIRLVNSSKRDVTLPANSKIGRITPVSGEIVSDSSRINSLEAQIGLKPTNRTEAIWSEIQKGSLVDGHESELKRIIAKYNKSILLEGELPGISSLEEFRVYPKHNSPIASNSYKTPYALRNTMKRILNDNVKKGLLSPTSSPYNSPTLLVKKPNGSWRLVVDYRRLNDQIESDCYPLPLIKDLITNLHDSKIFTSLDLTQGFHQVPLHEDSKPLLTIGNETGQYKPNVMPMGIKTAGQHLQRCLNQLFRKVPLKSLVIYMDDLLIHSRDIKSHMKQLDETFRTLASKNLQCKASKMCLLTDEVEFCGHTISNGEIRVSEKRIEALKKLTIPTSARDAQSLFGALNYLREMVPFFAEKAKPITKTYSGRFQWTEEATKSFEAIRDEIIDHTMNLTIPDCNSDCFVLETDSSNTTMAAVLYVCKDRPTGVTSCDYHDHDSNCLRPISFWSKNFTESQARKYYIREKELTCFRDALNHFRMYLSGKKFIWRTDNKCLTYAWEVRANKDSVARKLCEICAYDFIIQPRSSSQMKVSDCLTRSTVLNQLKISRVDFAKLQNEDPILSKVSQYVQGNTWPSSIDCKELSYWRRCRQRLSFSKSGELRLASEKNSSFQLLLPSCLEKELLERYHDDSGHPGQENTIETISRHFTWFGMRTSIEDFVRSCPICQADKPNLHPRRPPQKITDTPTAPFVKLSCDLIGPLPTTNRNSNFVFVANDMFSKKIYTRAIPNKKSSTTLEALKSIVYGNPRLPETIVSDNGLEFAGEFKLWLEAMGIKHWHSSPYHPQSNGLTERSNATLKQRLKTWRDGKWEDRLREMTHQINLTPAEHTRLSPYAVETGFDGLNPNCPVQVDDTTHDQSLAEIQKLARDRIVKEKESRSLKTDRPFTPFAMGDRVLLKAKEGSIKFIGPYEIIEVLSDGYAYLLKSLLDGSQCRRRVELLKPFVDREVLTEEAKPSLSKSSAAEVGPSVTPFGFDHIELAPNGGRMWPVSVPSPVRPEHETVNLVPQTQQPEAQSSEKSDLEDVSPLNIEDHTADQEVVLDGTSDDSSPNITVLAAHPELESQNEHIEAPEESSSTEDQLTSAQPLSSYSSSDSDLELVAVDPDADLAKRRQFEELQSVVKVEPNDQTMVSVQPEGCFDQTMVSIVQPVPITGQKRSRNDDTVTEELQPSKIFTRRRPTEVTVHDDTSLTTFVAPPNQPLSKESVMEFIRTHEDYDPEDSKPIPRCRGSKEYSIDDQNFFQLAKLGYKWGTSMTHSDLKTVGDLRKRLNSFAKSSNRITMTERNGKKFYIFR